MDISCPSPCCLWGCLSCVHFLCSSWTKARRNNKWVSPCLLLFSLVPSYSHGKAMVQQCGRVFVISACKSQVPCHLVLIKFCVCACVFVWLWICVCVYVYAYVSKSVYLCLCVSVYQCMFICMYMLFICVYISGYVQSHSVCTCMYQCVYVYVSMGCVCVYVYSFMPSHWFLKFYSPENQEESSKLYFLESWLLCWIPQRLSVLYKAPVLMRR